MGEKKPIGCLAVILIVMLVASYIATSSLNPLAVYSSDSILAKIIVSVLMFLLVSGLLGMLRTAIKRKLVGWTAHELPDDVICPGCGLALLKFEGSHGQGIPCPECDEWWHNGLACYSKGLPHKVVFPRVPCPNCRRKAASQDQDLFSDESDLA